MRKRNALASAEKIIIERELKIMIGKAVAISASMVIPHMEKLECHGWIKTKPKSSRVIKVVGYEYIKAK